MDAKVQRGFWDTAIAIVANDADHLQRVCIDHGFTPADDPAPADKLLAWYRPHFGPFHLPQPFTFTPEFVADVLGQMTTMDKDVRRRITVPRDFVFSNRIFIGLYSVLAALRTTADWQAIWQEDLTGEPTTDLGRLDADFFVTKTDA
jgi:hypothetical protein